MHVVVVAHTRHPIGEPFAGGLESLTWHLAQGLVRRGAQVSVFAAHGSTSIPGVEHLWPAPLQLSKAAEQDVSMPESGWMRRHHAYLDLMVDLARRDDVDLVHTHALHHLPVAMASTLRCPTVLTLHTPPTPWLESALQIAHLTDGPDITSTAVSSFTARAWRHLVEARVVANGVDTARWRPGPGGDTLVWSGRIVPEKAPHLAVRIARAAGMPLLLVGPIADHDYANSVLWPLVREAGGDVDYAGHLGVDDLAGLVGRSAAALVTPVWDEPFGLVAAEALACGTPVLALSRGGLPEVITPDVGRLVPVRGGEEATVRRAAELLDEVVRLDRRHCRAHALQHHSIERMVEGYLQVYADVLGQPRADGSGAVAS